MTRNDTSALNRPKASRSSFRFAALAVASALTLAGVSGCSASNGDSPPASTQSATATAIPKSGAGELAGWVVEQINAKSNVDTGELASRMDPVLLKGIATEELAKLLDDRQSDRKWISTDIKEDTVEGDPCIFVRLKSDSSDKVSILQIVQSKDTKLMNGIHFLSAGSIDFGTPE